MDHSQNMQWWNEVTPIHIASDFYDVPSFLNGRNTLGTVEREALGDVAGKRILHLMCHFGLDTISLARMGATVTGIDFSSLSIEAANRFTQELKMESQCHFIRADVHDFQNHLDEQYDIVFTSHGILEWLLELSSWSSAIAKCLKTTGFFYMIEIHPISLIFDELEKDLRVGNSYFMADRDLTLFDTSDYTDRSFQPKSSRTKKLWRLEEVFNSLRASGLVIQEFKEFSFSTYKALPMMEQQEDGLWRLPEGFPEVPFYFAVKATKA